MRPLGNEVATLMVTSERTTKNACPMLIDHMGEGCKSSVHFKEPAHCHHVENNLVCGRMVQKSSAQGRHMPSPSLPPNAKKPSHPRARRGAKHPLPKGRVLSSNRNVHKPLCWQGIPLDDQTMLAGSLETSTYFEAEGGLQGTEAFHTKLGRVPGWQNGRWGQLFSMQTQETGPLFSVILQAHTKRSGTGRLNVPNSAHFSYYVRARFVPDQ